MRNRDYEQAARSKNSSEILIAALYALGIPWEEAPTPEQEKQIREWIANYPDGDEFDISEDDDGNEFVFWRDEKFWLDG